MPQAQIKKIMKHSCSNNLFDGTGEGRMGTKDVGSMKFSSANIDGSVDANIKVKKYVNSFFITKYEHD